VNDYGYHDLTPQDTPEPLELRTPEYDYIGGAPSWVEHLLFAVMGLGVIVAAFYLGYMLGAS
jgi:hypothetical protein